MVNTKYNRKIISNKQSIPIFELPLTQPSQEVSATLLCEPPIYLPLNAWKILQNQITAQQAKRLLNLDLRSFQEKHNLEPAPWTTMKLVSRSNPFQILGHGAPRHGSQLESIPNTLDKELLAMVSLSSWENNLRFILLFVSSSFLQVIAVPPETKKAQNHSKKITRISNRRQQR